MPQLTIIIPTMNEADNIVPLVTRLAAAVAEIDAEILFVDDSSDKTPDVIASVAATAALPVRCIHRPKSQRDGLSGAVVVGLRASTGDYVCVMDGDLQHPPNVVPILLERAVLSSADIVVASRQANRIGPVGLPLPRALISNTLTLIARSCFPRSLKDVSDPLTGFFLVRRAALDIDRLHPDGFKILLEILVRHPDLRAGELLFDFALRHAGSSKADFREGMRFFRHVLRLRTTVHTRPLLRYVSVVFAAAMVKVLALSFLARRNWRQIVAVFSGAMVGDFVGWVGNRTVVFPDEKWRTLRRFLRASTLFNALVFTPVFALLQRIPALRTRRQISAALSIGITGFVRYLLSDRWIGASGLMSAEAVKTTYSIHDKLVIQSPVPLPDLAYFQSAAREMTADIVIRVDRHGTPRKFEDGVSFDDGIGRFGFAFTITPAKQIEVVISPIIAQAPHVLYVNIVEPLLRYAALRKGFVFVQAGAYTDGHGAVLVSKSGRNASAAATFEILGKNPAARYLAHDSVLIAADGTVFAFPHALTTTKLLESSWQRRLGAWMRKRRSLPAATFNAYVQRLFPPLQTPVEQVATIVSSAPLVGYAGAENDAATIAKTVLQNSADPLGFPLFSMLADYEATVNDHDLVAAECERLTLALQKA